ncbi:MAG: polysaccharide biosynthesis/export family protein [Bacteroidales bacterium]|nr:polysaccharide biosynthesis/export family protein [Candidatus Sodaliphilus aphodohippi]
MNIRALFSTLIVAMLLVSCNTGKDIPYMINIDQIPASVLSSAPKNSELILMPGDMLQINVSGPDEESVKPFNKVTYVATSRNTQTAGNNQENSIYYYLVDANGEIEYPMLGKVRVSGMTKTAAEDLIASMIYPKYLTVKPGVEIRLQNFHVYAIGEVNKPGVVKSSNDRMNVLEAIALAGDLTIKGKRDNIRIIRTNADGSRQVKTINLNDPNIIVSPDFYLQQNDCIYVEPNASKARSSWNVPPALSLGMSSVGTVISLATFIIALTK